MTTVEDVTIEGDDSQNAIGNTVSGDLVQNQLKFVRGRPSMVLSESMIVDRVAGYVPASNHDEIVETLRRHSAVALSGSPGAGVVTTAIAALRTLRPGLPLRYFSTDDDVEEIQIAPAHGYLVRAADERRVRLWSYLDAVRASGGFLLLVGSPQEFDDFADLLAPLPVQPPSADAVYRHRLRCQGLDGTRWPHWPRASELLKDGLPRDGRRLADLVLTGATEGGNEEEIEQAYQGWNEELRRWFADHREPRDMALMVAAATITPADETSVYSAALSLARELEIPVAGGGLTWCPATGLVPLLGVDRDGDRVVFRRQGFARAVLRHVWDEYPLTRTDLLPWLSSLAAEDKLKPALCNRLAEVFADLAAEQGSDWVITQTARDWTGLGQRGADLAYVALARTCLHPLVGGRVRRALYEWSRERRAPQTLKLTVARVCQVLGETHLSIALTRLKHLATYGNEQVQDEVFTVARALADRHPGEVFEAALTWCRGAAHLGYQDASRRMRVALRLLLTLLDDGQQPARTPSPPRLQRVLGVIEELAIGGDPQLRIVLMATVQALATHYPAVVIHRALAWAATANGGAGYGVPSLAILGTDLFLAMAAEEDPAGLAAILTGPAAIPPQAGAPVWSMALGTVVITRRGFTDFETASRLWLDTAVHRPDLRPQIVATLVSAAGGDPQRGQLVVYLARRWAGTRIDRRGVQEDILMRLLMPIWHRYLLILWVNLRSALGTRR